MSDLELRINKYRGLGNKPFPFIFLRKEDIIMNKRAWMIYFFNRFFNETMYFIFLLASGIALFVFFVRNIYFRKKYLKISFLKNFLTQLISAIKFLAQAITLYVITIFAFANFVYKKLAELFIFRRELIEEYKYHDDYELEGGVLLLG